MSISPNIESKLKWLLYDAYPIARHSVIYAEVVTGELNYSGISELRDVLDHIQRALDMDNEEDALKDLESAYEHIRRGAVESVQSAATKTYFDALKVIRYPNWLYKVLLLEVPDKGQVRGLRMNAMEKIARGRSHKSDKGKWLDSIKDFKEAIDDSFKIIDMNPTKAQVRFQLFVIICGLVTISSLIFAFR
jgi:tetratricopeptide (TPR) repeat protein